METKKIHPLLADKEVFLLAGVYDCLSAKLAERAGFPSVFLTGFGAAATGKRPSLFANQHNNEKERRHYYSKRRPSAAYCRV